MVWWLVQRTIRLGIGTRWGAEKEKKEVDRGWVLGTLGVGMVRWESRFTIQA